MKNDKTELFERLPIPSAVAKLAVPTVMSTLVMVLYNMADTYFVGILNDPVQNAAVTLAAPVLLSFNAVNNLFGMGSSSAMSRALGRKDFDTVRGASSFSFYCALASSLTISLVYTLFRSPLLGLIGADAVTTAATRAYLLWTVTCGACPAILNVVLANMFRSEGAAGHASIGVMSGCLINILLDPFFILPWGLGMGAAGAGLATFLANCFACLYYVVLLFIRRGSTYISLNPARFRVPKAVVLDIFGVGIPSSVQNLLNVTGMTILNNFTSVYGADAVAAMGISHKVNLVPLYFCMGLTQGVMPLVGYNYASGNHKRMKNATVFVLRLALGIAVAMTILFYLFANNLILVFMKNEGIAAYGVPFLRAMCIGIPFMAVDFFAVGVFQALGKGRYAMFFALMRKLILEIPALFILNKVYPLYGLAYAQTAAEIGVAVTASLCLLNLFRRLNGSSEVRPHG